MDGLKLRFVPLGGIVGVTKNLYAYELYSGDTIKDILIVDCGIGFPQDKGLGVDFVIPDITYLEDKTDKIRGVLLSHAHEDHISALPYHYQALGRPPVYASKLTSVFVQGKFAEFKERVVVNQIDYDKEYTFGDFKVEFIHVTHSIPDTVHMVIKTPLGNLYHGTDFKFDLTPPYGAPPDFYKITKAGKEGILCLLSDCLGAQREGLTLSENIVAETFENAMRGTRGKFIMSTFSSNISRIRQCVETAIKFGRKVVFLGWSMRENTKLASQIGYLPLLQDHMIKEEQVMRAPPHKVCIIAAGAQGQYNSAIAKLANNQNRNMKIKPGDKIVFSSDPIPGNEPDVYAVIEQLMTLGADVVYPDVQEQLHASGHGNQEDLKFLIRFTNPKYLIPIGGTIRHQREYADLAQGLGYKRESIFLLNEGETLIFEKNGVHRGGDIETKIVYVDAYGVGDVGNVVLRDRKTLSAEGMVAVVLVVDNHYNLVASPRLLSRGFVFEKTEKALFKQAEDTVSAVLKPKKGKLINVGNLKKEIADNLEQFFYEKKGRRPLIVVDIVQM